MEDTFNLPSLILNQRQLCDLELILNGGFRPLTGFLGQEDYESVLDHMTLDNGSIWPMPITLDVRADFAQTLQCGQKICLKDQELFPLAILEISSIWQPDKLREAQVVFGTQDDTHPGVFYLINHAASYSIGGYLELISLPRHYDFKHLRLTPDALKVIFESQGWQRIVGFQTRNPMHRAHYEITVQATQQLDAHLLLHPVVGMTPPGDVDVITRMHCYQHVLQYYPSDLVQLALLPLAMRMAGPREALWHALIRKNYGCTHFIIGRDHAGPGKGANGDSFYSPYAAQELVASYQDEIGIEMVAFEQMVYVPGSHCFMPINTVKKEQASLTISGSQFRQMLYENEEIPEWFSYPAVISQLRHHYPLKYQQGFTVFFTGLSGSGKSTLANVLLVKLRELSDKQVTVLDGDMVRQLLSSGLSFSKSDRDLNVARISFVASEITKHRGVALCAPIAPYEQAREKSREIIEQYGGFIEVYVSTPLQVCEQRDPKGLYQQARAGVLLDFTGVDSPYEVPLNPDVIVDTSLHSVEAAVYLILEKIIEFGFLPDGVRSIQGYNNPLVVKR